MANTNLPRTSTHQQVIIPPVGGGLYGRDKTLFRYFNNYPVIVKQLGQDPDYYVKPRPPATDLPSAFNSTTVTKIHAAHSENDSDGSVWWVDGSSIKFRNALGSITGPLDLMHSIVYSASFTHFRAGIDSAMCLLDFGNTGGTISTKLHFYSSGGGSLSGVTTLPTEIWGNRAVFLDGYLFIASHKDEASQRIYNSTLGNPEEWLAGANFIDAEMTGDSIVTLAKHHNHIVAFGRDSIEFFYNSANEVGSPLSRQAGYAQNIGMYDQGVIEQYSYPSDRSFIEINDDIYFLAARNNNLLGLYRLRKFAVEKVSDAVLDDKLRRTRYNRLQKFDLNGEHVVLILDEEKLAAPTVWIPSTEAYCEFQWTFYPERTLPTGGIFGIPNTFMFKSGTNYPIALSGERDNETGVNIVESMTSQYQVDYLDFNNNAYKHWKYVDVLGSFGSNGVAIAYRNDSFGLDNASIVNLPYQYPGSVTAEKMIRFRNLGRSRRQGYAIFFSGSDDYLYKGIAVGYNQWGE